MRFASGVVTSVAVGLAFGAATVAYNAVDLRFDTDAVS